MANVVKMNCSKEQAKIIKKAKLKSVKFDSVKVTKNKYYNLIKEDLELSQYKTTVYIGTVDCNLYQVRNLHWRFVKYEDGTTDRLIKLSEIKEQLPRWIITVIVAREDSSQLILEYGMTGGDWCIAGEMYLKR